MNIFENVQMVVFDMAGTTIDENGIVYKTLKKILNSCDIIVDDHEFNQFHGVNKVEVLQHFINKYNVEKDIKKAEKEFYELLQYNYENFDLKVIDGTKELFEKLRNKGIKVCLNTGYKKDMAEFIINKVGLNNYINGYITSDQVKHGRPYPYMINRLMEEFEIPSSEYVIKIGDTCIDIQEGRNAHTRFQISVLSGADNRNDLSKLNPYMIVNSVKDLIAYL